MGDKKSKLIEEGFDPKLLFKGKASTVLYRKRG